MVNQTFELFLGHLVFYTGNIVLGGDFNSRFKGAKYNTLDSERFLPVDQSVGLDFYNFNNSQVDMIMLMVNTSLKCVLHTT